jgi:hypothetical protein
MGMTSIRLRERQGQEAAPYVPPNPSSIRYDEHARVVQELTVKYEKELSKARASGTVNVSLDAEVQKALESARAEFEKLAATLTAENEALKTENSELKMQLESLTAPAAATSAEPSTEGPKKGGRGR